jgi:hypothetical protein
MNATERRQKPELARYTGEYLCRIYLGSRYYSAGPPERRPARRKRKWIWDDRLRSFS